jgi:hypothetical protein
MATLTKIHPDGTEEVKEQGARVEAIQWDKETGRSKVVDHKPVIGCSLLVGSVTARTYSDQDWWLTTPITEMIQEIYDTQGRPLKFKFKTNNSIYELRF